MITLGYKPVADLTLTERHRLAAIAEPHYEDATQVLNRDLHHCSHIYLTYLSNEIVAFFMVGWETLTVAGRPCPALFLGLSCADNSVRHSKLTSAAYIQSSIDLTKLRLHEEEIIIWGTTATPIILKVVPKFWNLIQPSLDGSFDEKYRAVSDAIKERYYRHRLPSSHPFVLKGVATGTRYSETERVYLNDAAHKINIPIFETLGIDEQHGDRLLMLMEAPGPEKLAGLRKELAGILAESTVI